MPRRSSNGARECALKISSRRAIWHGQLKFSKHCSIGGIWLPAHACPRVTRSLRSSILSFQAARRWSEEVLQHKRRYSAAKTTYNPNATMQPSWIMATAGLSMASSRRRRKPVASHAFCLQIEIALALAVCSARPGGRFGSRNLFDSWTLEAGLLAQGFRYRRAV